MSRSCLIDLDAAAANRRNVARLRRDEAAQPSESALRKRKSRAQAKEAALRDLLEGDQGAR